MDTIMFMPVTISVSEEERAARRPIGRDPEAYAQMLSKYAKVVQRADELGIDAVGHTEHHMQTEGGEAMANSLLHYGKLAGLTKNIKFMPLSMVLPVRDPIRVAEDLAIFDHLYPGRLAGVAFARGYQTRWMQTLAQSEKVVSSHRDKEADSNNRERFDENLLIVEKAWAEDSWNYDGKHFKVPFPHSGIPNWPAKDWTRKYGADGDVDENGTIHNIGVAPKPLHTPRIFRPSIGSATTLVDAAKYGHSVMLAVTGHDAFRAACKLYQDEARKAGFDLELGQNMSPLRHVMIGDTFEEAMDLAVETSGFYFQNFFQKFGINEGSRIASDDKTKMVEFDTARELMKRKHEVGELICGTVDQVTSELAALKGVYGDGGNLEFLTLQAWSITHPRDPEGEIPKRQIELYTQAIADIA